MEVISEITMATAATAATGENTVHSLKELFSTLPLPQEIPSDNGSHFTATVYKTGQRKKGSSGYFTTHTAPKPMVLLREQMGWSSVLLKLTNLNGIYDCLMPSIS